MSDTTAPGTSLLDVVIVGAGFAGLYMLHALRSEGFTVRVFEAGPDVGGTWYWNRYPGARCDVESIDYSYSFSEELQQEWTWSERYATQPEILRYLHHVADRFDLRRDIELGARVKAAVYDETTSRWQIATEAGGAFAARYCVMATGALSAAKQPDLPGLEAFAGTWHHTARWPAAGVDFADRRVAVVGTGSTGIQAIPVIADQARHLTIFQRTPNFSVPARNRKLSDEELATVKATYPERRARARQAPSGVPSTAMPREGAACSDQTRLAAYEAGWAEGGAPGILRAFSDVLIDQGVNDSLADFVRGQISATVTEPGVAGALLPVDHPIGAKRLCVDTRYYETYNRSNVELVDLRESPIVRVTRDAVETTAGRHPVDIIVFAIGFDAITGAVQAIDVRGRGGVALREQWADGPRATLGLMASNFPSMFLINGPGSPAVLGNAVTFIEHHVEWITRCLVHLRTREFAAIEPLPGSDEAWADHVSEVAAGTLYPKARSWFVGANVPGKPIRFLPYAGGLDRYARACDQAAANDYAGFMLAPAGVSA